MSKLVLVLGAGASVSYGYPTGTELLNDLTDVNFINSIPKMYDAKPLFERIRKTGPESIDQSLSYNMSEAQRFKPILALKMLQYENKHLELPTISKDNWYQFFFNPLIVSDIKKTEKNLASIEIITFNYDRSLEYVLSNMIHSRCYPNVTSLENTFKTMSYLKIHHVYGRLPALPGENYESDITLPYGSIDPNDVGNELNLLYNSKQILHTCYEEKQHTANYNNIIFNADKVLMLGFAYHENNMNVLGYKFKPNRRNQIPQACYVYGTAYKIDDKPFNRLVEKYQGIDFEQLSVYDALKKNYEFINNKHTMAGEPLPPVFKPRERYTTPFSVVD